MGKIVSMFFGWLWSSVGASFIGWIWGFVQKLMAKFTIKSLAIAGLWTVDFLYYASVVSYYIFFFGILIKVFGYVKDLISLLKSLLSGGLGGDSCITQGVAYGLECFGVIAGFDSMKVILFSAVSFVLFHFARNALMSLLGDKRTTFKEKLKVMAQ